METAFDKPISVHSVAVGNLPTVSHQLRLLQGFRDSTGKIVKVAQQKKKKEFGLKIDVMLILSKCVVAVTVAGYNHRIGEVELVR